jgi:hypothetical protein
MDSFITIFTTPAASMIEVEPELPVDADKFKPTGWCVITHSVETQSIYSDLPVNADKAKPTGWCVIC